MFCIKVQRVNSSSPTPIYPGRVLLDLCSYRSQHLKKPRSCQIPGRSIAGIEELRTYNEGAIYIMLSIFSISICLVLC